jgi:hypothetical protein
MLKRDNIFLGVVIGLVLPALFYGVLYATSLFVETGSAWTRPFEKDSMMVLSIAINLVPIRLYFVKWKFDKTGRGILFITFLLVVAIFIFKKYL